MWGSVALLKMIPSHQVLVGGHRCTGAARSLGLERVLADDVDDDLTCSIGVTAAHVPWLGSLLRRETAEDLWIEVREPVVVVQEGLDVGSPSRGVFKWGTVHGGDWLNPRSRVPRSTMCPSASRAGRDVLMTVTFQRLWGAASRIEPVMNSERIAVWSGWN